MAQSNSPPAVAAQGPSLAQAVEAAWQRAVASQEARGQEQIAVARQSAASAWTPKAPSAEAARRNGRFGASETELGISVPLWVPGQRSALQTAASADLAVARAAQRAARWRVSGEVREAAWALTALDAELAAAREQLRHLQSLSVDVDRRVRAGDLARADALVARAEALNVEAAMNDLQQRIASARAQWESLTGLAVVGDPNEPASMTSAPDHPELALAEREAERAQAMLESQRRSRRDSPEVAVSWKQERPGDQQARQDSVGIALRLPFGADAERSPQEAVALAAVETARIHSERLAQRHALELRTARQAVVSAEQQLASAQARSELLQERAQLLDKSFRAGETALPDLLRALDVSSQAVGALARQRAALGLARARLQQSLGVTP